MPLPSAGDFWVTRWVFQRGVGLVYLIAFVVALNQFRPLLGENGLLPVSRFVQAVPFRYMPSLFYLCPRDIAFTAVAWIGIVLSCLAVSGLSDRYSLGFSIGVWGALWVLYMSFVNVGQTFYSFGWESLLLETGFYTMFLGSSKTPPSPIVIWMLRWLLFRVMFGAGMIKMRGDPCWRDLTCLDAYYETQPMPNSLSWYFHVAPVWTHRAGVLFNHFAELVAPWGYFVPGVIGVISGVVTLAFQGMIFASGNLSWLNFLTLLLAIPTLNDRFLLAVCPWLAHMVPGVTAQPSLFLYWGTIGLGVLVAALSIRPILNILSPGQLMNTSYNPLHLVGSYGAFGSITRPRYEVILEGTDAVSPSPDAVWKEYEIRGKPGNLQKNPPQIAPYHLRLGWLMWFAAMSSYQQHPWFIPLVEKMLRGDRDVLGLFSYNPFPDHPPHFIQAELYEYHFTTPAERRQTGRLWNRERAGLYFPPVALKGNS